MDYTLILIKKYIGSEWTLNGDDYDGLTWLSDSPKPSKAELDAHWAEVKAERDAAIAGKVQTKADLLARLGITADEAALLLS